MSSVRTILRVVARLGANQININSQRVEAVPMWTRPTIHRHGCSVPIELSDDGRPLSEFPDWPSLVRAADEASTLGQLTVGQAQALTPTLSPAGEREAGIVVGTPGETFLLPAVADRL